MVRESDLITLQIIVSKFSKILLRAHAHTCVCVYLIFTYNKICFRISGCMGPLFNSIFIGC